MRDSWLAVMGLGKLRKNCRESGVRVKAGVSDAQSITRQELTWSFYPECEPEMHTTGIGILWELARYGHSQVCPQMATMDRAAPGKPGRRSFFRIFHIGAGGQKLEPSSAFFSDTLAGSWIGSWAART